MFFSSFFFFLLFFLFAGSFFRSRVHDWPAQQYRTTVHVENPRHYGQSSSSCRPHAPEYYIIIILTLCVAYTREREWKDKPKGLSALPGPDKGWGRGNIIPRPPVGRREYKRRARGDRRSSTGGIKYRVWPGEIWSAHSYRDDQIVALYTSARRVL